MVASSASDRHRCHDEKKGGAGDRVPFSAFFETLLARIAWCASLVRRFHTEPYETVVSLLANPECRSGLIERGLRADHRFDQIAIADMARVGGAIRIASPRCASPRWWGPVRVRGPVEYDLLQRRSLPSAILSV